MRNLFLPFQFKLLYALVLVITSLCFTTYLSAQNVDESESLSVKKAIEDIDQVTDLFVRHYPNLGLYQSKKDFLAHAASIKDELRQAKNDRVSLSVFAPKVAGLVAKVGDGHSCVSKPTFRFPLAFSVLEDAVVLEGSINEFGDKPQVLSLNGKPIYTELKRMAEFTCIEGAKPSGALKMVGLTFSTIYALETNNKQINMELLDGKGRRRSVEIENSLVREDGMSLGILGLGRDLFHQKLNFELVDEDLMYLRIPTFLQDAAPFEAAMERFFQSLEEENPSDLIIDVRGNFGGQIRNASLALAYFIHTSHHFPEYLHVKNKLIRKSSIATGVGGKGSPSKVREKIRRAANKDINTYAKHPVSRKASPEGRRVKTRKIAWGKRSYKGRIHVLIDETTASAAAIFASHLKRYRNATFYGMPLSGSSGRGCMRSNVDFQLKNSNLNLSVAWLCFMLDGKSLNLKAARATFEPDFYIERLKHDYQSGIDTVVERVKKRILGSRMAPRPRPKPFVDVLAGQGVAAKASLKAN